MDPGSMYPHFGPGPWTLLLVFHPPPPPMKKEIREGEMNNKHNASKQHPVIYIIVLMTNCM